MQSNSRSSPGRHEEKGHGRTIPRDPSEISRDNQQEDSFPLEKAYTGTPSPKRISFTTGNLEKHRPAFSRGSYEEKSHITSLFAVLHLPVLCRTMLYCSVSCCPMLYCSVSCCTVLHCCLTSPLLVMCRVAQHVK